MSHSYNSIWLHVVFSTKDREPLMRREVEEKIHKHIREQLLIELGGPVRIIHGMADHVHLLFLQNPKIAVADTIKQVKGNTSHRVNSQDLLPGKFAWQTGYAAYSVSDSSMNRVFEYIRAQKEHHAKKTFYQEYEDLLAEHNLTKES